MDCRVSVLLRRSVLITLLRADDSSFWISNRRDRGTVPSMCDVPWRVLSQCFVSRTSEAEANYSTSKAEYEDIVRQVAISCRVELSQRLVKCGTRTKETYKDSSLQLTWAGLRYSGSLWLASTAEPVKTRWDVRTLRQVFDHCCADEKELLDSWVRTTLNLLVMSKYSVQ